VVNSAVENGIDKAVENRSGLEIQFIATFVDIQVTTVKQLPPAEHPCQSLVV